MHEMRSRVAEILEITRSYSVLSSTYIDYWYITIGIIELSIGTIVLLLDIHKIIYVLYKYNLV
jgi:hypothetical protein